MNKKYTIVDMQVIAKSRNGKCISTKYVNLDSKLLWECQFGHKWMSTPYSIRSLKTWCPICSGNTKKSVTALQELAKSRGGKCLSEQYFNVDTKYNWECSLGHTFSNTLNKVSHGQWCPICNKSGISEEVCRIIFEMLFNEKFPRCHPSWLKTPNGHQMEIDGYSENLKIGFEYHGRQHFMKSYYISSDSDLNKRKKYDSWKIRKCQEKGVRLFVLTYKTTYNKFIDVIRNQAKTFKIDLSNRSYSQEFIQKAYIKNDRIEVLKKIIESNNGKLLSTKWLGTAEKYKVMCNIDGHIWKVSGNELLRGVWCKICSVRSINNKRKLGIEIIKNFAKSNGGICLSNDYVKSNTPYIFKCKNDHVFRRVYWNMKLRNQWCPYCAGDRIKASNRVEFNEIKDM